jgi:glyoxalase family protein
MGWWQKRLVDLDVEVEGPAARDGEDVLTVRDPDGLVLELVASPGDARSAWDGVADIPAEHAVRGLYAVTMSERLIDATAEMLAGLLSMEPTSEGTDRARFAMPGGGPGAVVDVAADTAGRGLQAGGTVHHVAFRAPDGETQRRWREELVAAGVNVTEVIDRQYFTSIYFREPGGVLLEIATDQPGFTVDEPLLELGRALKLPPWLEPSREQISHALPRLRVPESNDPR